MRTLPGSSSHRASSGGTAPAVAPGAAPAAVAAAVPAAVPVATRPAALVSSGHTPLLAAGGALAACGLLGGGTVALRRRLLRA